MTGTKNSISSLIAQFMRLQRNSLEIINGLNKVATSNNNKVEIEMLDEKGLPTNIAIPSFGYMRSQINRIDNNIQALIGLDGNHSTVRNPDGSYSQIYKSRPIKEPDVISDLSVPSTFAIKDNWFFESFLNPLLFIEIDIEGKVEEDISKILVKRIIANTERDSEKAYFDSSIKNRNDIEHDEYINLLDAQGISYFVDEEIVDLPLRRVINHGKFSVLSSYNNEIEIQNSGEEIITENSINYRLNTLNYSSIESEVIDSKILNVGDKLITEDGTKYEINRIDPNENSIQVKRISGYQPISIGSEVLTLSSENFTNKKVQVNIGFDERQAVFFKSIDDKFNIIGSTYSKGIAFYSNDLTIKNKGKVQNLADFYHEQVFDMGQIFLGAAKEQKIPSIYGLTPNAPLLDPENFKVVQINKQITDNVKVDNIKEKASTKSTLSKEIEALDNSIQKTRSQINLAFSKTSYDGSEGQSLNLGSSNNFTSKDLTNIKSAEAKLDTLIEEKKQKQKLYNSLVEEIAIQTLDAPQSLEKPKYRIRGFFDIPLAKVSDKTGNQEVIQFIIRYRYLSETGAVQTPGILKYKTNDGKTKEAVDANWIVFKTGVRKKVYDNNRGIYIWSNEIIDGEGEDINKLDIPINKGERVEIQIRSISEAGWPENPLNSDWSNAVIVSFPEDLYTKTMDHLVLTNAEDKAVLKIKEELASMGLISHLETQFNDGNKEYSHNSESIASGFYDGNGNQINLFAKLQELSNEVEKLKAVINKAKGSIEVYLDDGAGNQIKVSRGSVIKLNAGTYSSIFPNSNPTDFGKIVSKTYMIRISNSAASPLELESLLPGGQDLYIDNSNINIPNYNNLLYHRVPISITGLNNIDIKDISGNPDNTSFRHIAPFASSNSYGQFLYPRYKTVGHDDNLYVSQINLYDNEYDYTGINIDGNLIPQNGESFIPFDPSVSSNIPNGGTGEYVWNGLYFTGGANENKPMGEGILSEFCIHKDHPLLNNGETTKFQDLVKPDYENNSLVYPAFRHSNYFHLDHSSKDYFKQIEYRKVNDSLIEGNDASIRSDSMYPDKLGFHNDDEYLIGKYSCGAYLFISPKTSKSIQVDGSTSLAKKEIEFGTENSINIPLIFQFRSIDKLGFIGGYRNDETLTNITYIKRIGIDIKIKNDEMFSFDVEVTGKHRRDILVSPNFTETLMM